MSSVLNDQICLPVLKSSAYSLPSSQPTNTLPSAIAAVPWMPSSALNAQSCLSDELSLLFERPVSEAVPRYIGQLSAGAAGISAAWLGAWPSAKSREKEASMNRFMTSKGQPKKARCQESCPSRGTKATKIQRTRTIFNPRSSVEVVLKGFPWPSGGQMLTCSA